MEAVPQPTASGGAGSTVAPRLREGGDGRAVSGGGGPGLRGRLGAGGQQTGLPTWPCGRGGAPCRNDQTSEGDSSELARSFFWPTRRETEDVDQTRHGKKR